MAKELADPILQQAEQKVESQLTPANRDDYLKIVTAGMHVLLDKGPDGILAKLSGRKDPVGDCAKGAIGLVLMLSKQSKGIMPPKAMVPAAMTLMLKGLDFANQSGIAKVGNDELVRATHIFTETIFRVFHISKGMLQNASVKVHALTNDPVAMEKIKRAAGVVKHPDASTPTPMPGAE